MKVFLDTVGCRLNQAEIEKFAAQFHAGGHEIVPSPGEADLTVVNTCTVTLQAASDSRQKIRQAWKAGCARIVPVGCLSTLEGNALLDFDGVDRVIPNIGKDQLVSGLLEIRLADEQIAMRQQVEGERKRTRAFIKAQDGCDQHCTYCVTRFARGASRSIPADDVISDIHAAERAGAKEAVLTGVQLGSWGRDLSPEENIASLVRKILNETSIPRLRLSSIEPWGMPAEFFSLWENPRLCPQLHLPLQSGCAETLKRMGRQNTPETYGEIVEIIRGKVPDIAITTDLIVGFPGETESEFEQSLAFIENTKFAGGHVFQYSGMQGTASEKLAGKIDPREKKARSRVARGMFRELEAAYQRSFVGRTGEVLWEGASKMDGEGWLLSGLTGNYIRVHAAHEKAILNEISNVIFTDLNENGMQAKII